MLSFVRAKTRLTSKTSKEIKVYLHPEAKSIIDRLGNKPTTPDTYIFPIINGKKDYAGKEQNRKRHRKVINQELTPYITTLWTRLVHAMASCDAVIKRPDSMLLE